MTDNCTTTTGGALPSFTVGTVDHCKCVQVGCEPKRIIERVITGALGSVVKSYFESDGVTPFLGALNFIECPKFVSILGQSNSVAAAPSATEATQALILAELQKTKYDFEVTQCSDGTDEWLSVLNKSELVNGLPVTTYVNQTTNVSTTTRPPGLQCFQAAGIETKDLTACLNGIEISGFAVLKDSIPPVVISELWRGANGVYGALPAGSVVGKCASSGATLQNVIDALNAMVDREHVFYPACADGATVIARISNAYAASGAPIANSDIAEVWSPQTQIWSPWQAAFQLGPCSDAVQTQLLGQIATKPNPVQVCIQPPNIPGVPTMHRVSAAWNQDPDTGQFSPGFVEIIVGSGAAAQVVSLTNTVDNATSFTAAGPAFGFAWSVVVQYAGTQVSTVDGTVRTSSGLNSDGFSFLNDNVTLTGPSVAAPKVSKFVSLAANGGPAQYFNADMTPYALLTNSIVTVGKCPVVSVNTAATIQVPQCVGTPLSKSVDSVVGAYLLNAEHRHTEVVFDVVTAAFGGEMQYLFNAPRNLLVSRNFMTLTGDSVVANWTDFGDGYTGSGSNPVHNYQADGEYEIKCYCFVSNGNKVLVQAQKVTILNGTITYSPAGIANAGGIAQPVNRTYKRVAGKAFQDFCGNVAVGAVYGPTGPYTAVGTLQAYEPAQVDDLEASGEFSPAPPNVVAPLPIIQKLVKGLAKNYANGLLVATHDPQANGNTATLNTIITQNLESFTVHMTKGGNFPASPNNVTVDFGGGNVLYLIEGQAPTWSISQDSYTRADSLDKTVTITANGNSAFTLHATMKAT
jgi:hypothetical protein